MSATWDKDQKIQFVFTNLYQTYRKGRDAAREASVDHLDAVSGAVSAPSREGSRILKAGQLDPVNSRRSPNLRPGWTVRPEWAVREHRPVELLQLRRNPSGLDSPRVLPSRRAPAPVPVRTPAPVATPLPSVAAQLKHALSSQNQEPLARLERQLDAVARLQKRIGVLLREIEGLSKGSRRDDRE